MKLAYWIIGILAILAALSIILRDSPALPEASGAEVRSYESTRYGYSFDYPGKYEVEEYRPESVSVGIKDAVGFAGAAEVSVIESDDETIYESYDAFLEARAKLMCAADGPRSSVTCTGIESSQPFVADSGVEGTVFYLIEETVELSTTTVERASKGPFYAFDVSSNNLEETYTALLFHPPIATPPDLVDATLIRDVARTVKIR